MYYRKEHQITLWKPISVMRRLYSTPLLFLIGLISVSCSDSVSDLNTDDVIVSVESEELTIQNYFTYSIYYFAVDAGTAAYIQWAAISTDENRVKSRSTKRIPVDQIYGFEPGKDIIVYYWSEKEPSNNNIKSQRIGTD